MALMGFRSSGPTTKKKNTKQLLFTKNNVLIVLKFYTKTVNRLKHCFSNGG